MLIFAVYLFSFTCFIVKIAVTGKPGGDKRHNPSAFAQNTEHRADRVTVPAILQLYRAPHNAVRAH